MGIGNFMFYLPVLRALSHEDLTVICPNQELRVILDYNLRCKYEPIGKYDVAINNFLCQRNEDIKKIWRIPVRIGHDSWWRKKYTWVFNYKVPMNQDKSEEYYNCKLLDPLGIEPVFKPLEIPDFKMPKYDIILSTQSASPKKDWEHWDKLTDHLRYNLKANFKVLSKGEYPLIVVADMIRNCKLFIGNDSGLAKISANLGIPTIAIFRWFTDCFVRCRIKGINLIEPTLDEVLCHLNKQF